MKFNQTKTIPNIQKHVNFLVKTEKLYKPFFTVYAKKRYWLNSMKYILGEYKFKLFKKDRQPPKYKNAFELFTDSLKLDLSDIELTYENPNYQRRTTKVI